MKAIQFASQISIVYPLSPRTSVVAEMVVGVTLGVGVAVVVVVGVVAGGGGGAVAGRGNRPGNSSQSGMEGKGGIG